MSHTKRTTHIYNALYSRILFMLAAGSGRFGPESVVLFIRLWGWDRFHLHMLYFVYMIEAWLVWYLMTGFVNLNFKPLTKKVLHFDGLVFICMTACMSICLWPHRYETGIDQYLFSLWYKLIRVLRVLWFQPILINLWFQRGFFCMKEVYARWF